MALTKSEKKELLDKVSGVVKDSKTLVFVAFNALTVSNATEARKGMKKADVGFLVAKKTIAKKALMEAGLSGEMPELGGQIGIAFGKDLIAPAREAYAFQKMFDKKFSIMGGVFDGKFMTKEEMMGIALIPSRETLLAQFVNLINSPIQRFAVVISEIAKSKGGPAEAAAPEAAAPEAAAPAAEAPAAVAA